MALNRSCFAFCKWTACVLCVAFALELFVFPLAGLAGVRLKKREAYAALEELALRPEMYEGAASDGGRPGVNLPDPWVLGQSRHFVYTVLYGPVLAAVPKTDWPEPDYVLLLVPAGADFSTKCVKACLPRSRAGNADCRRMGGRWTADWYGLSAYVW